MSGPISPLRSGVGRAPTISTCAICHRKCKLDFHSFFALRKVPQVTLHIFVFFCEMRGRECCAPF
ncbi:unnamed protein product [Ixodes pacificus]